MERRTFLAGGLAAAGLSASTMTAGAEPPTADREYYELRHYLLRLGPQSARLDAYLKDALIPAAKRLGLGPVGAFSLAMGLDSPSVYVLLAHKSAVSALTLESRLDADAEYQKAGEAFLNASYADPPYLRVESSLMVAFSGLPVAKVPVETDGNKPRLFELRTYESHSRKAHQKKVEMFNKGETNIFHRLGMQPVFFGETLIGARQPNLTYMLTFADMADRDRRFGAFVADPEWKKLSAMPEYAQTQLVTGTSSVVLRPLPYSQI